MKLKLLEKLWSTVRKLVYRKRLTNHCDLNRFLDNKCDRVGIKNLSFFKVCKEVSFYGITEAKIERLIQ
jgi:hypothetical protein